MLRRYGSVNVPITSLGVIAYGTIMAISPVASFTSLALQKGPFLLASQRAWGVAFIVSGLLALAIRHVLGVMPLLAVVAGWGVSLMLTALTVEGVSPVAGIAWAIIAVQLLVSVSIRGTGAVSRREP